MKNEKLMISKALEKYDNANPIIRISKSKLQTLKEKIILQSSKLSSLKQTGPSRYYHNKDSDIKKENRSNDCARRHQTLYDSMLQKPDRKGSEANSMLEMYHSNIPQANHKKNKSQLQQSNNVSPKYQYQNKLPSYIHAQPSHDKSQTRQKTLTLQYVNQVHKKLSLLNVPTSPTTLKTFERLKKRIVSTGENSIKYSLLNQNREKTKQLKINDFLLINYIEKGQFGQVYLAKHTATNFICALKKIPKSIFEGQMKNINQLIRQVKIQSFLDHPHIIQLYACFDEQDHIYLMLQYCNDGNLYNMMKRQIRLDEQKAKKYLKQICHALDYMHDNDIIHRDIKPQNILLHNDMVKICDFGWSINSPLLRKTQCGTPLYSSPQMIERKPYDSKEDIWHIGILAYQLLYGKVPFQIRHQNDLIKIVQEEIFFPIHHPVSLEAKDFIRMCLNKSSNQRPPINKLLDHEFLHK